MVATDGPPALPPDDQRQFSLPIWYLFPCLLVSWHKDSKVTGQQPWLKVQWASYCVRRYKCYLPTVEIRTSSIMMLRVVGQAAQW